METRACTIGILEDDESFRDQLVRIVESDFGLKLVFASGTLGEALAAYRTAPADLVLVDMQLPDGEGIELIRLSTASGKASLMLTMLADHTTVMNAFEAGAQAYLLKDMEPGQIHAAIIATLAGQSPISPAVAKHLLQFVRAAPQATLTAEQLTERELTILNLIARGLTYAETARAALISVHTVGDHIKAIYRKLGVNSKTEAIYEARQIGLLKRYD